MAAHLHIDALGGVAGDMFAAALFDLGPAGAGVCDVSAVVPLARSAGLADDVVVEVVEHSDGTFRGRRFLVRDPREKRPYKKHAFILRAGHHEHPHVPVKDILRKVDHSALSDGAKARARDVFLRLAVAEGAVHGLPVDDVALHEVGAQDSICDVVTAAVLLDMLDQKYGGLTASVSSLPTGSGRVQTAHGELPVPAPATLSLLEGLLVHDDGRPGERVTPTGAAIVRHLLGDSPRARRRSGVVQGAGVGFGTRTFDGLSNIVRVTLQTAAHDDISSALADEHRDNSSTRAQRVAVNYERDVVAQLACDIDDMTGEELGHAAAVLRDVAGVKDVTLTPVFMKKGRPGTSLSVLCDASTSDDVMRAMFLHTSTLGVRTMTIERVTLPREHAGAIKRATRPDGTVTHKVEHDALPQGTLHERRRGRDG